RKNFASLLAYVQNRIPEISDELYRIDDAMKAGFGWQHAPFEFWYAIGIEKGIELIKSENMEVASWVTDMVVAGKSSFYTVKDGATYYYDIPKKQYIKKPGQDAFVILDNIRTTNEVWKNPGVVVEDLGDGILNIEFTSKMNTLGAEVIQGLNKAIDIAEKDFQGLIVGNQGANFSVGANIGMIFMMAVEQEYDELNFAIKSFQ